MPSLACSTAVRARSPRLGPTDRLTTTGLVWRAKRLANEKLVSLVEAHTDVLVKDRRATYYGHRIYFTTGRSGLSLDCAIPKGNPGDVL